MRYLTYDTELARYVARRGGTQRTMASWGTRRLLLLEGEKVFRWVTEFQNLARRERQPG